MMSFNRAVQSLLSRTANVSSRTSLIGQQRSLASSRPNTPDDDNGVRITVTDDRTTIVCWHPPHENDHPYEHTLPYVDEDKSVFKLENLMKGENLYFNQKKITPFTLEQVQALTFTPKFVWRRRRYDGLQMRPKHPRKGV